MGEKFNRNKSRIILLSIFYKIHRFLPLSKRQKTKLYLDLEWIFNRLSHESSFYFYKDINHPFRSNTLSFLKKHIKKSDNILDLGCKYGEISYLLSKISKTVVGIDYDEAAINIAKTNFKEENLTFYCEEAYQFLSKDKHNFSLLILSHVLEHLDDPLQFLKTFINFFERIYIEIPDFDATYLNKYRKAVGSTLLYTDIDHISEFDREDIATLIKECNLIILDSEHRFGVQRYLCSHKSSGN